MATHSSILAWRIPWTEEPGGLQSTGVAKSWQVNLYFPITLRPAHGLSGDRVMVGPVELASSVRVAQHLED